MQLDSHEHTLAKEEGVLADGYTRGLEWQMSVGSEATAFNVDVEKAQAAKAKIVVLERGNLKTLWTKPME